MSLFIGKTANSTSLIATTADKSFIRKVLYDYFLPKLGQLKLVAYKNKQSISGLVFNNLLNAYELDSVDRTAFNGWVYADGAKYSKASFLKAYNKFSDKDSNTFTVPNINDFIKTVNFAQQAQFIEQYNAIIQHSHEINASTTGTIGGIIKNAFSGYAVNDYGNTGSMLSANAGRYEKKVTTSTIGKFMVGGEYEDYYPSFHNGCGGSASDPTFAIDLAVDLNSNFGSLNVSNYGANGDIYPNHIAVGVMVYIGIYEY